MFYVTKQKRIYVIGGDISDNIWYCQIHMKEYKWCKLNIKLPYINDIIENKYNTIIAFDIILFVFYYNRKQVCCSNLENQKIYVCTKNIDIYNISKSKLINTKSNMVQCVNMDYNGPTHNVANLTDIFNMSYVKNGQIETRTIITKFNIA